MQERILVIDDDATLNSLLAANLRPKGYEVLSATHAREGLKLAYENHPDLVILDVMMPEIDGWQACQRLREISDVPIIMLTAKSEEEDIVRGLQLGADDFIKKPFGLKELEGRIRAVLRRIKSYEEDKPSLYEDGTMRIDLERQRVWRCGQAVNLAPTEYRLLQCLVKRKGSVVTHGELLAEAWGPGYDDATAKANLSLYIRYLREKLERDPSEPEYIQTRWGVGYLFAPAAVNK